MAKPKLVLAGTPTFKAVVGIPVPGAKSIPVEFVFKHRDREAYDAFVAEIAKFDETDLVLEMVSGWDLEDAFDRDNVTLLINKYIGSARAIFNKYIDENTGAKLGN